MNQSIRHKALLALLAAILLSALSASAQKFSVASFRLLPNDVSAFIEPVRDLNGDDCALLKVQASPDFAFSTPLGIVKRVDNVGEIWLYLPKGSKKLTLKHPQWGVLRDYVFPEKLGPHKSYELRIDQPDDPRLSGAGSVSTVTMHDTLVLTRVDTLVVAPVRQRTPLLLGVEAVAGFGGSQSTALLGARLSAGRRVGGYAGFYISPTSTPSASLKCVKEGAVGGSVPFYSGKTRHSAMFVVGGLTQRLSSRIGLFEGIGYGRQTTVWQLAPSEGGGYVENEHYSAKGVSFELGARAMLAKRITVSLSVMSIKGKEWFGAAGVGIDLSPKKSVSHAK